MAKKSIDEKQPTVYLDHLIRRESLRYQKGLQGNMRLQPSKKQNDWLSLRKLAKNDLSNSNFIDQLRKPDFQRATLSWTAEDCILLLESLIEGLAVPSIVMWTNPSTLTYILDGAHRVSVAMAWLADNWGETTASQITLSDRQAEKYKQAAKDVRDQIRRKIGHINDFEADYKEYMRLEQLTPNAISQLDPRRAKRAQFYADYIKDDAGFHIQWVIGNYDKAEQSFLRINRSGRQLTPWETNVVAYRNSSAMRLIMSVANPESAEHYWPQDLSSLGDSSQWPNVIGKVHGGVSQMRTVLFHPTTDPIPFVPGRKPLLGTPKPAEKPTYIGQLLCVLAGNKGTDSDIANLLEHDKNAIAQQIVMNGQRLIERTLDSLSHIVEREDPRNPKSQNKSLNIVPLLYFYQPRGDYIRGMIYGFLYWMLHGEHDEILLRKRLFTCYRQPFEQILLTRKNDIVSGMSRRSGSASDVTTNAAKYFDGLLSLLIRHNGNSNSSGFLHEYSGLMKGLTGKNIGTPLDQIGGVSVARTSTTKQRAIGSYLDFFQAMTRCGICGGYRDPADTYQDDHILDHAKGGQTRLDNLQRTHPFCNNSSTKDMVQDAQNGKPLPPLPSLT